jgi:hypothetical protein
MTNNYTNYKEEDNNLYQLFQRNKKCYNNLLNYGKNKIYFSQARKMENKNVIFFDKLSIIYT